MPEIALMALESTMGAMRSDEALPPPLGKLIKLRLSIVKVFPSMVRRECGGRYPASRNAALAPKVTPEMTKAMGPFAAASSGVASARTVRPELCPAGTEPPCTNSAVRAAIAGAASVPTPPPAAAASAASAAVGSNAVVSAEASKR